MLLLAAKASASCLGRSRSSKRPISSRGVALPLVSIKSTNDSHRSCGSPLSFRTFCCSCRSGEKGLSLKTLLEIASELDIALVLKFVPFSRFLREYEDVSPDAMKVESYDVDKAMNAHFPMYSGSPYQQAPWQSSKGTYAGVYNIPAGV